MSFYTEIEQRPIINKPFFVFFPGFTGGGRELTALRQISDLFVPSSISTKKAFKHKETSVHDHLQNLANEIAQNAGDRELFLLGHSLEGRDRKTIF